MKGCMAVWTAAVSVTMSKGGVFGGGMSGTLGSEGGLAVCIGRGVEPDTVRFPPAEGVGQEGGVVAGSPIVRPSSAAVSRRRTTLRSRMDFFKESSSCFCLLVS